MAFNKKANKTSFRNRSGCALIQCKRSKAIGYQKASVRETPLPFLFEGLTRKWYDRRWIPA